MRVSSPVLRGPGGEIPPGYLPTIRSSDEAPVMGVERRDCIIQFWTAVNLGNKGGTNGQNKALEAG